MVALAILAFSFVSLVLLQGRAVNWALQARNISIATQLARYQLAECKKEAQKKIAAVGDLNLEGDFTDFGYPDFTWECHAPKLNIKLPSDTELTKVAKKKAGDADVKNKVGDVNTTASAMSPFVSIISDTLRILRELAVIVRWKEGEIPEEVRVVTHVTDHAAMIALSRVLSQGAETLLGKKKGKGQEGPGGAGMPGGPMGGGMRGGPMGGGMRGGPMGGGMRGGPMGGGMPGGPMGGGMPGGPMGGGMPGGPMGGGMMPRGGHMGGGTR